MRKTDPTKPKRCGGCGETKPLTEFHRLRDGWQSRCKKCQQKAGREWGEKHPGHRAEHARRYRAENPRYMKDWMLRNRFGITLEDYERMLEEQNGVCWICERPPGIRLLAVDHNHETGSVRRLLCAPCNQGLGMFDDDVKLLMRAVEYLQTDW